MIVAATTLALGLASLHLVAPESAEDLPDVTDDVGADGPAMDDVEPEPEPEPETATPIPDPPAAEPEPAPAAARSGKTAKFDERKGAPPPSDAALDRDTDVDFGDREKTNRRGTNRPGSPQRFAAEFKLGPYLPDVDRNYSGPGLGPYGTIFGQVDDTGAAVDGPKPGLMPAGYFEWQFLYLAGPLGVGAQVGFFRDRANALYAQPMPGENLRSGADKTTFGMVPVVGMLSYRFELLADRFRWVPIVPFAKAGVGYSFWWIRDGNGKIATNSQGEKAHGGVLGFQFNVGGMIRLDFIEPSTARKLDQTTGINHTYVFGEFQVARYNNFGVGNSISIGDDTWFAGLAIEF